MPVKELNGSAWLAAGDAGQASERTKGAAWGRHLRGEPGGQGKAGAYRHRQPEEFVIELLRGGLAPMQLHQWLSVVPGQASQHAEHDGEQERAATANDQRKQD